TPEARKNTAIICDWKTFGATFVENESPTGEMSSSPKTNTARVRHTHSSGVALGPASEKGRNMRKPMPMSTSDSPALTGVEICFGPSFIHMVANRGAKTMTKNAGISWIQLIGI